MVSRDHRKFLGRGQALPRQRGQAAAIFSHSYFRQCKINRRFKNGVVSGGQFVLCPILNTRPDIIILLWSAEPYG